MRMYHCTPVAITMASLPIKKAFMLFGKVVSRNCWLISNLIFLLVRQPILKTRVIISGIAYWKAEEKQIPFYVLKKNCHSGFREIKNMHSKKEATASPGNI